MRSYMRGVAAVMAAVVSVSVSSAAMADDAAAWGPAVPIASAFVPASYPERTLGSPDAKITIYEYASLTCPHCARWENEVFPQVKANYIDTGKIRYVYRDYPLDNLAYAAAVIGRCLPEKSYYTYIEGLFKTQNQWAVADVPITQVKQIAALAGLSSDGVDACLKNQDLTSQMDQVRKDASDKLGIDSTPTFIIGGYKKSGEIPYEDFAKELDAALADAK